MKKTGIFYASNTGTTAEVASRLGKILGIADSDIHNVADTAPSALGDYDTIILGSSTWGNGDLADDMYDFVDGAQSLDLHGHRIAFFGCGDESMSDTFCDAVGKLYFKMKDTGAKLIGEYPADGYTFDHSEATDGNTMRGLVLDEVNHPEYTERRLQAWAKLIEE